MRHRNYILFIVGVITITGCNMQQRINKSENVGVLDTLSVIDYEWPFAIDDNVPILLPPIKQIKKNYVVNKEYKKYIAYDLHHRSNDTFCGTSAPLDSIFWINKLISDLELYVSTLDKGFKYTYIIICDSLSGSDKIGIVIIAFTRIATPNNFSENAPKSYKYIYDNHGILIGAYDCNNSVDCQTIISNKDFHYVERIMLEYINDTDNSSMNNDE